MSGGELAVVLASVAVVVAVAVLGAVGMSLGRSLKELRRLLVEIRRDLLPAVQRIEDASGRVTGEVQRVGGLLDVAEAVSERADSLSRVTYRAFVEPFAAVASLFRRGGAPGPEEVDEDPAAAGWDAPPRPRRRASWTRRATVYLLRSGYRAAAARLAAAQAQARLAGRLAAAQAQRGAATRARSRGGEAPAGSAANDAAGASGATPSAGRGGTAGLPRGRQLVDALREVTNEISAALEEGRRTLAERRGEDRPK
ncbi:MAG: hypothetical protein OXE75_17735 [bacterium]|nr:hypothetical protein [bacterium]